MLTAAATYWTCSVHVAIWTCRACIDKSACLHLERLDTLTAKPSIDLPSVGTSIANDMEGAVICAQHVASTKMAYHLLASRASSVSTQERGME
jgi:hypothetical protein